MSEIRDESDEPEDSKMKDLMSDDELLKALMSKTDGVRARIAWMAIRGLDPDIAYRATSNHGWPQHASHMLALMIETACLLNGYLLELKEDMEGRHGVN